MPNLRRVGQEAEDQAAGYLIGLGYTLITRRYHARTGEIDLIAMDGDTLVFVEVKHRRAPGYAPEGSVGERKVRALCSAARSYLASIGDPDRDYRFDLIAIDAQGLRHYQGVFQGD